MNLDQAYQILGVNKDTSEEDLKKVYKKQLAKMHPDVNKEKDAEAKFKEVQAAYQTITNKDAQNQSSGFGGSGFSDFMHDPFEWIRGGGGFHNTEESGKSFSFEPLTIHLTLTFIEAVEGVTKTISITRNAFCDSCQGSGGTKSKNKCGTCKGTGGQKQSMGPLEFTISCHKCNGTGYKPDDCKTCKGNGYVSKTAEASLPLPGGLITNQTLQVSNAGHASTRGGKHYAPLLLHITVIEHPTMKIQETNVVSNLKLSLLEALEGTTKEVETIKGKKSVKIPAQSKHGEQISLPKLGVKHHRGTGQHIITLKIEYPKDLTNLINTLKKENL